MHLKKIFAALIVVIILAYSALWYFSCKWLEDRIPKEEFTFSYGKDSEHTLKGLVVIDNVSYSGILSGHASIKFNIKSISYEFISKDPALKPTKSTVEPNNSSFIYVVSAPLYGNTLKWAIPDLGEIKNSLEISPGNFMNTYSKFSGGGLRVFLYDNKFLLFRKPWTKEDFSNSKQIFSWFSGFELLPGESSFSFEGSPEPMIQGKVGPSIVNWDFKEPNMLHIVSNLDIAGEYGKSFFSEMLKMGQNLPNPEKRVPIDEETLTIIKKVESILLDGANKFLLKGGMEVYFPYDLDTVKNSIQQQGSPPAFSAHLNNFSIQFPYFFTAKRDINGFIDFMRGDGKPLKSELHIYTDPFPVYSRAIEILKQIPAPVLSKFPEIDFSKKDPRDLHNFEEFNATQGMYVLTMAALKAYDSLISAPPLDFDFKFNTHTNSGVINPIEFLGAKSELFLETIFGQGFSIKAKATASGITKWSANLTITNVRKLLEELSTMLRIGLVHAFLNFGKKDNRPSEEIQGKIIQFIFSDEFEKQMIDTLVRVVTVLDQNPNTANETEFSIEGAVRNIMINGQDFEQFKNTHQKFIEEEFKKFFVYVQSELSKFDQKFAEQII